MRRVLIYGVSPCYGGTEAVVMNYYNNIDRSRVQFDFLLEAGENDCEEEICRLGGRIFKFTTRRDDPLKFKKDMTSFFEAHAHEYCAMWANYNILANIEYIKYARKYGVKNIIVHSHNSRSIDNNHRKYMHLLNRRKAEKIADEHWACSSEAASYFFSKDLIKSNKVRIINNAIDVDRFKFDNNVRGEYRKELGVTDKTVIGAIGRLHFQKNPYFILDIFSEIGKLKEDAIFLMVGEGVEKEGLLKKVQELGIEEKVRFLGSRPDVNCILQAIDLVLMPSLFEGLSVSALEAQAADVTLLASDVFSPQTKVTDSIHFLSLDWSAAKWAEYAIDCIDKKDKDRSDTTKIIAKAGFSIKDEARKLQEYFEYL